MDDEAFFTDDITKGKLSGAIPLLGGQEVKISLLLEIINLSTLLVPPSNLLSRSREHL